MEITVPQMFHQHNYPRNEYRSPTPLKPHTHSHPQTHTCSALHTDAPERNPMPSGGQGWQNRDQMMSHTSHQWDGSCERDCALSGLMCSRRSCQTRTHTQIPHTRKNTHRHTSAGAATPRGVDFAMDTHTSKNKLCCNAATSD